MMNNKTPLFDRKKQTAFAASMRAILNGGMLTLMVSIGHQTKLFEIMSGLPPSKSIEIANEAGLNERYVREWLAAMVVGRIIEYDDKQMRYSLPPEHASFLTTVAGPNNMARSAQVIPLLAAVEERIIESFRKGGGVPYSVYPRFMELVAESSSVRFDNVLLDKIIPLMPNVVKALKKGINVLEVGCGPGHAINLMAEAFPRSSFTGYDLLEDYIEAANLEAKSMKLSNVRFELRDMVELNESDKYDLITAFDVIHDLAKPHEVLKAIAKELQPDGTFFMADVRGSSLLHENMDHPMGPWLYSVSCLHCMPITLVNDGAGLGSMWGEQKAKQMLIDAGFTNVTVLQIPGDIMNNYYVATKNSTN